MSLVKVFGDGAAHAYAAERMAEVTAWGQASACDAQDILHVLYPTANAAERRAMTRAMQARKRRKRLENDSAKQVRLSQSLHSVSALS
jgi:hypothetical protein